MPLDSPTRPGNRKNRSDFAVSHVTFLTFTLGWALLIAAALPTTAQAQGNSGNQPELKPINFRPERFPSPLRPTVRAPGRPPPHRR